MNQDFELDLQELAKYLLKRIWSSVLLAIIAGALFLSYSVFFTTPTYTSYATLYVINRQSGNVSSSELMGYESLLNDYMYIISSRAVLESVIEESGTDMTYAQLKTALSLSHKIDTRIITVGITHSDPAEAVRLVNLVCTETREYITDLMKSEQIKIIDYGNQPTSPSSPGARRNLAIGIVLGFMIPLIINIVIYVVSDKIITAEDLERRLGVNVIGRIPYSTQLDQKSSVKKRKDRK